MCHSIDLIAKQAMKSSIPSHVEYFIRESYNWFAHSPQRLQSYQEIARLIGFSTDFDDGKDLEGANSSPDEIAEKNPPKLLSPSDTRWLAIADCIEKILGQFDALKTHFQLAYSNERCYQAKILHEMFCDEKNYLFLLFLHPILKELKRLTKLFQSNSADFLRVFLDLESAFLAFGRRILKPAVMSSNNTTNLAELNIDSDFCLLEPGSVDLGSSFLQMLERSSLTSSEKLDMKMRGKNFLKEIFQGFQKRLRGSFHLLKKIDIFSYENFMKSTLVEQNFLPPFFPTDKPTLAEVEQKSKLLQASTFPAKETDLFWADVHFHQDSSGNFPFRPLSTGKNLNE